MTTNKDIAILKRTLQEAETGYICPETIRAFGAVVFRLEEAHYKDRADRRERQKVFNKKQTYIPTTDRPTCKYTGKYCKRCVWHILECNDCQKPKEEVYHEMLDEFRRSH